MAVPENGHGPDSVGKTTEPDLSGVKTKRTGPVRWTIGVVVRYVYAPRRGGIYMNELN